MFHYENVYHGQTQLNGWAKTMGSNVSSPHAAPRDAHRTIYQRMHGNETPTMATALSASAMTTLGLDTKLASGTNSQALIKALLILDRGYGEPS